MRYFLSVFLIAIIVSAGSMLFGAQQANAGASACTVVVIKETIPSSSAQFNFVVTGSFVPGFSLMDGEQFGVGLMIDNVVTITELQTPGFLFQGFECSAPGSFCGGGVPCLNITPIENGLSAECLDNDVRFCTFTNLQTSGVPTLSEWGLISTAAILGLMAVVFLYFRKRKAEA